ARDSRSLGSCSFDTGGFHSCSIDACGLDSCSFDPCRLYACSLGSGSLNASSFPALRPPPRLLPLCLLFLRLFGLCLLALRFFLTGVLARRLLLLFLSLPLLFRSIELGGFNSSFRSLLVDPRPRCIACICNRRCLGRWSRDARRFRRRRRCRLRFRHGPRGFVGLLHGNHILRRRWRW